MRRLPQLILPRPAASQYPGLLGRVRRVRPSFDPPCPLGGPRRSTRHWGSFGQGWGVRIKGLVRFHKFRTFFLWKRKEWSWWMDSGNKRMKRWMCVGWYCIIKQMAFEGFLFFIFVCVFYPENNWSWCLEIVLIYSKNSYRDTIAIFSTRTLYTWFFSMVHRSQQQPLFFRWRNSVLVSEATRSSVSNERTQLSEGWMLFLERHKRRLSPIFKKSSVAIKLFRLIRFSRHSFLGFQELRSETERCWGQDGIGASWRFVIFLNNVWIPSPSSSLSKILDIQKFPCSDKGRWRQTAFELESVTVVS